MFWLALQSPIFNEDIFERNYNFIYSTSFNNGSSCYLCYNLYCLTCSHSLSCQYHSIESIYSNVSIHSQCFHDSMLISILFTFSLCYIDFFLQNLLFFFSFLFWPKCVRTRKSFHPLPYICYWMYSTVRTDLIMTDVMSPQNITELIATR